MRHPPTNLRGWDTILLIFSDAIIREAGRLETAFNKYPNGLTIRQ
jgi:hypothetical protein